MSNASAIISPPDPEALRRYPFLVRQAFGLARQLEHGSLAVIMPDGAKLKFGGLKPGPAAQIIVRDNNFASRLASEGEIGLAEAYLQGEWDSPDLTQVIELFGVNHTLIEGLLRGKPLTRLWQLFGHWRNRNTKTGSRRNIAAHYDLGNQFYEAWLDGSMTYSSALFTGGAQDLAQAQRRKYHELAAQTGMRAGDHVLEIGCGWGGFAEFAAREVGCHVTGLTISKAQHDFARERIFKAGLNDRVEIKLQDYRDERGVYDKIASIEMFEAVGEEFWPAYFTQLRDRLKPGGAAGLQVITIKEAIFGAYKRELDFIRRYIFPGGMLPTLDILRDMGAKYGVPMKAEINFGADYARTLVEWRRRFRAAWPVLTRQGFDERFRRMWEYYLAYCEGGFRSGNIDVRQMVFAKGA
jgi:cyclopropane-fatty-acyl-phospholipid synthase